MRVAALYDIHGHLAALEAVMAEVVRERADHVVVGGDVVMGPQPAECLAMLAAAAVPITFIRGNTDRAVAWGPGDIEGETGTVGERRAWTAAQLSSAQLQFLAGLPTTAALEIDGFGRVLFCHGTPRADAEIVTRITPETRLQEIFAGIDEAVIVCGHTHVQYDRTVAGKRVVNAGSVGMPFADQPGAYWAMLGPEVALRRTPFDTRRSAAAIRATDFPEADVFAAENVITVPSAETMTERFERMAAPQPSPRG